MLDAGHATNALPQRARAIVNCRIFPGVSTDSVRAKLEELVADPAVKVMALETRGPTSSPPPLTPAVMGPIEKLAAQFWPGVPVLPILQAGATDGEFTNAVGIPTFGVEPVFVGRDLGHIDGLDEYVGVKSLFEGRDSCTAWSRSTRIKSSEGGRLLHLDPERLFWSPSALRSLA